MTQSRTTTRAINRPCRGYILGTVTAPTRRNPACFPVVSANSEGERTTSASGGIGGFAGENAGDPSWYSDDLVQRRGHAHQSSPRPRTAFPPCRAFNSQSRKARVWLAHLTWTHVSLAVAVAGDACANLSARSVDGANTWRSTGRCAVSRPDQSPGDTSLFLAVMNWTSLLLRSARCHREIHAGARTL